MQISIANIIRGTLIGNTMSVLTRYISRVVNGGGIVEAPQCVETSLNSQPLLQQASLLVVPSGYKGGTLYSEIPTNGDGDLTWTRASDAFRTNASGLIQRVPWNLLQYSEQFDNGVWSKSNVTVSANTTTAPNGTLTADTLTTTATTGRHLLLYGDHSATTITASIYVKKNTHNFIQIFTGWAAIAYANYDINNGVLGDVGSGTVASITNVGDGWYRCVFTSPAASASTIRWNLVTSSTAVYNESWSANGTESVYLWGGQLVEGTTAQTYLPTTDRLNFPRLSYMYGSCPSVLLEPQRTNLVFPSEDFSTTWSAINTTVTTNQATAPDGNLTADRISITSNGGYIRRFSLTTANSSTYTASVYVKNDTISAGNTFNFYFNNNLGSPNSAECSATININSGTVTSSSGGLGISNVSASIQSLINGWYRVNLTFTLGALAGNNNCEIGFTASTATRTFFAWGAQLEVGAYPTTYIPTTSATATRVADSFIRNNIYTNGLITSSGGTWFVELRGNEAYTRDATNANLFLDTSNGGVTNGFSFLGGLSNNRIIILKYIGGATTSLYTTTTSTTKIAIKWNGTTADVFVNGTKQVSATAFTPTGMEFLNGSGAPIPLFIQQMALYPSALSDTDCTTITTL